MIGFPLVCIPSQPLALIVPPGKIGDLSILSLGYRYAVCANTRPHQYVSFIDMVSCNIIDKRTVPMLSMVFTVYVTHNLGIHTISGLHHIIQNSENMCPSLDGALKPHNLKVV